MSNISTLEYMWIRFSEVVILGGQIKSCVKPKYKIAGFLAQNFKYM